MPTCAAEAVGRIAAMEPARASMLVLPSASVAMSSLVTVAAWEAPMW